MKLTWAAGAAIAALSLGIGSVAAQENTPQDPRLFELGKLTVSTSDPAYPPWVLDNDPASGLGFEAALVYALAAQLGFAEADVVWVDETFEGAIAPGEKQYDFSIQQISVTEERAAVATFSQVYYQPEKAVIALTDSDVGDATTFEELREARWGVAIGTTDLDYVENVLGIEDAAVYNDQVAVFQAMQAGQIDATVTALPTALYVTAVQVEGTSIVAILPPDEHDQGFGLLFEFENPIVSWIDQGLAVLKDEGVIDALIAEFLISDLNVPVITE